MNLCGTIHLKEPGSKTTRCIMLRQVAALVAVIANASPKLTAYDIDARMGNVHVEISLSERVMLGLV
jgi:hypothetical protein